MFLVVVDAYSKWPEMIEMPDTTAQTTVDQLHSVFARWTARCLTFDQAQEFDRFMSLNNIKCLTLSQYHLAMNGQAERLVQTLKQALKVSKCESKSLQHRLASFLLQYRNSHHASTETSPALLMIGRELHSRLHLLKPDLRGTTLKASTRQVMSHSAATERLFSPGEKVLVRDYRPGHARWQSGVLVKAMGVKTYVVQCENGGLWKRHSDQVRPNPVGLKLKDPLSSRELTEEVDAGPPSRAASEVTTTPYISNRGISSIGHGGHSICT